MVCVCKSFFSLKCRTQSVIIFPIVEEPTIKKLAIKNNLPLVDADSAINKDQTNFLDSAHLTTQGMSLLAKCIAEKINLK